MEGGTMGSDTAEIAAEQAKSMSSGEALAEILRLTRETHEGVQALIGFVNEAGEQINQLAGQGIGELIGSLTGNGKSGD